MMHVAVKRGLILAGLVMLTGEFSASGQDWPNWRGPNHDGISPACGLRVKWDAAPPKLWEFDVGSAFSGISCVGDRAYTCGTRDGKQVMFCLSADTGKLIWQKPFERQYKDGQGGHGTRATPTVDEDRVYIQGGWGRVVCFGATDGKELWNRTFDSKPVWGYSGSVLIEGDLAIVAVGGDDGALQALNKRTGKTVWKSGSGLVGYATPYPFTFEGRRYIVAFLGKGALIVDAKSGLEVCDIPWETSYDVNAAAPVFHDGYLLLSSGYRHGSILLKLTRQGKRLQSSKVWQNKAIRAKFQSPVLYEGYLYTSDEVGLKCVEFTTGEVKWSQRRIKHGTVVIADGKLFVLTEGGELLIGKASPNQEKFVTLSKFPVLSGRCWTVPTLHRKRLYARNLERAVCIDMAP